MPITEPFNMRLLENAMDLDGHIINPQEYKKMVFRRRLMTLATFLTMIGIGLYAFAVISPNWAIIDFVNSRREHVNVLLGVWGEWRKVNTSEKSEWISHFPEPASDRYLRLAGVYLKHYYRVQAAFSIIALLLMLSSNALAIYTFVHHRYMYKRLVAALFIIAAMCIVVCCEVLTSSISEWNLEVVEKSMKEGNWDYSAGQTTGYPVYIAWAVVVIYFLAAIVFIHASHKQKGNKAATAEFEIEDRPVHIGRF